MRAWNIAIFEIKMGWKIDAGNIMDTQMPPINGHWICARSILNAHSAITFQRIAPCTPWIYPRFVKIARGRRGRGSFLKLRKCIFDTYSSLRMEPRRLMPPPRRPPLKYSVLSI